ncbi:MAG: pyridine nucleotide-disulfide oxidoreductase [Actinobacteria bacterium]|uniref:Tetratricopeptide repeat protein 38 n=1 Tax=freshwater metagenome TaxID=449393 RepID=A0A6J6NMK1_9ZZZZ|nr:pyridine nucleotide-disulfide oxidoreductase [Actinomycetota bacterium]
MDCVTSRDRYGLRITAAPAAARAYDAALDDLLRLRSGAVEGFATAIALDPAFALGHAALALLGHESCARVDIAGRMRDAERHAPTATERERSHIGAVLAHLRGDSQPLLRHLGDFPLDAMLLSTAVPTIAFAGVTSVPDEAWSLVESAGPAYGDDWWFTGLLAFVRQEQGRFDEAMELSCRSLAEEPGAGHSAHARAHAHYETGDHQAGLRWMDAWVAGDGASIDSLSHFSWHAALHELSMGDLDGVRRRYETQLRPQDSIGCRALVDTGSLLWRWALTPGAADVPGMEDVIGVTGRDVLERPSTPFLAMHAAVALLSVGDVDGLEALRAHASRSRDDVQREVVAPLASAMSLLAHDEHSAGADALAALSRACGRLGGSDAQREVVEETRIAALLRAGRWDDARSLIDRRLDRRTCRRDEDWRRLTLEQAALRQADVLT